MKIFVPVISLLLGFGLGWYLSGKRIEARMLEAFPEPMRETMGIIAENFETMSREEVREVMDQIKVTSEIMISEFDHQSLGGAMAAERIMRALSEGEIETAQQSANQILFVFKENYESGMELGDWQKVADAVYERNAGDENQTGYTTRD